MKRLIYLFLTLALTTNAFASMTSPRPLTKLKFAASSNNYADSIVTQFLKVVPGQVSGFQNREGETSNLKSAFSTIEAVINSEEFKEKVINYIGQDGKRAYTANQGLTNEQIYEQLMQGKEILGGDQTLGEMNFDITRYYKGWSKVIGYTSIGQSNWINVNGKFYARFSAYEMAGNITHEWIHLNGFKHANAQDHDSVPYAVGYIMNDLAQKYLNQGFLN